MTSEPPNAARGDGAPHDDTTSPETPATTGIPGDAAPAIAPSPPVTSVAPEAPVVVEAPVSTSSAAADAPAVPEADAPAAPEANAAGTPLPVPEAASATPVAERRGIGPLGYLLAGLAGVAIAFGALALSGSLSILEPTPSPSPSPDPSPSPAAYVEGRWLGDADAPVTLEIWADFQCPYCGLQARAVTPSIERLYAAEGRVRMTFRDFAFLGEESLDAAVAARCAGRQGSFWYFHDLLFASQQGENQGAFARENLLGLAQFSGLDQQAFSACLADAAVRQEVIDETQAGRDLQVASTPIICIKGPGGLQAVSGLKPLSAVTAAIEQVERAVPSAQSPSPDPSPSPGASPAPDPCHPLPAGESPEGSPGPSGDASPSPGS